MRWIRQITFVILPLLLALAAPVLILWAWGNNWPLLPALLSGIMFLAAAMVVHLSGQLSHSHADENQEAIWRELHALRHKVDALAEQATWEHDSPGEAETLRDGEMADGGDEGAGTTRRVPAAVDGVTKERPQENAPSAPAINATHAELQGYQLFMEPVVDITSGRTALYRAHAALPADGGRVYLGRNAQLRARTLGRAAALQARTLDGCLTFAHRLRTRGAELGVVCPLDVAVLAQDDAAERLLWLLGASRQAEEVARTIYFAIPFNDLATSSREARMHLMMLAQSVAGFILDHEGVLSPDAPLPLPLPVRHVDIPGRALALAGGLSDMGALAARYHERGWQIIASDISDDAAARQVAAFAGLARGGHYSPPRRVREETVASGRGSAGTTASASEKGGGRPPAPRMAAAR